MPRHARRTSPSTPPTPAYSIMEHTEHHLPCKVLDTPLLLRRPVWASSIAHRSDAIRGQSEGNQRAISCSNHLCDSSIARFCHN
jgi:hypothetical protein